MRRSSLILISLVLAGCMTTPEYKRPELPVADSWPEQYMNEAAVVAGPIHWRDFFHDPRLQGLISAALANNRDLRITMARLEVARAESGIARAQTLPSFNLNLNDATISRSAELAGAGNPTIDRRTDFSIGVVSFEIDFWNRLGSLSESARASYLATEAASQAARLVLVSEVANAYFTLLELQERQALARSLVEHHERSVAINELARSAGFASNLEVLAAQEALESARSELAGLGRQFAEARNRLDLVVGGVPANLPEGIASLEEAAALQLAPGIPSDVLLSRPDIVEAEQRLRAEHANIAAARAAFFPKILLTATLGLASPGLARLFNPAQSAWTYRPTMTLPLFDWGRLQGELDLAEARKNVAVAEYEKKIQEAFREVADLLANRVALSEQQRSIAAQSAIGHERVGVMEVRFQEGYASALNVLEAKRTLIKIQQASVSVRRLQLENAALLYKALGGGARPVESG